VLLLALGPIVAIAAVIGFLALVAALIAPLPLMIVAGSSGSLSAGPGLWSPESWGQISICSRDTPGSDLDLLMREDRDLTPC
jgi:hypothetical protein